MSLQMFFEQNPKAALAFSGGVDSSYLLYAAAQYGADVRPYFFHTPFQPAFELEDAKRVAAFTGIELTIIEYNILSIPEVQANPSNRCYYCKTALFTELQKRAAQDGYTLLLDGTNASDDASDRPGMRALRELSVRSPLRECGLTKQDVRNLSREVGLFTWEKPSYACLATRIPSGTALTRDMLHRVEFAEQALFDLGFSNLRVRVFHDAARIQIPEQQWKTMILHRSTVLQALKPFFPQVLLDLEVR